MGNNYNVVLTCKIGLNTAEDEQGVQVSKMAVSGIAGSFFSILINFDMVVSVFIPTCDFLYYSEYFFRRILCSFSSMMSVVRFCDYTFSCTHRSRVREARGLVSLFLNLHAWKLACIWHR